MRGRGWLPILASVALAACGPDARRDVEFRVETEFGMESVWTEGYLVRAARVLTRLMDTPDVQPPTRIAVTLTKDPKSGGIGGAASATELRFTSNVWPEEPFRHWILAHELTNLFAHHYAGSGGFPSDWWSNGRSPFPEYVSCLVMAQLGFVEDAAWRKGVGKGKRDHELYWTLHRAHGFELFAKFFRLLRADGVDLGKIGKTWPHADAMRSTYAIAYLSLAAGQNLATVFRDHGIGKKPSDWDAIHPDKPFEEYEVAPKTVDLLLATRERLFVARAKDGKAEPLRARFRAGEPSPR